MNHTIRRFRAEPCRLRAGIAPVILLFVLTSHYAHLFAQSPIQSIRISAGKGVLVSEYVDAQGTRRPLTQPPPLFTMEYNGSTVSSATARSVGMLGDSIPFRFADGFSGSLRIVRGFAKGWKGVLTLRNTTAQKAKISNVIPLGRDPGRVYIASAGTEDWPFYLNRSQLFRPGKGPIGVVLPDNAWEIGFCDARVSNELSLAGLARRTGWGNADRKRSWITLEPGGWATFDVYIDAHASADWRDGLSMMFRERYLYDLDAFDNALFERADLQWIRSAYLLLLRFAWDRDYYDAIEGKCRYYDDLRAHDALLGGFDAFIIWPTWPRLGLDERNQFDLYRDLPGGIPELKRQADSAHALGRKYFISYNPWDEGTRKEDHLKGMTELIKEIGADGVVLDTRGESSRELQAAADAARPGVIMYSEGMAIPKNMPTIVSGRVHDALYMPPPLNLNKYIKPEFAIFRVQQVKEGEMRRESGVSFFNGYGTEVNVMRAGRPAWMEEEFRYLGKTTKLLRENTSAFTSPNWTPLLNTFVDSIWVNKWESGDKTVYTVFSLMPQGYSGPLFAASDVKGKHYVDLWNHEEVEPVRARGVISVPVSLDAFNKSWLGTRREGSVGCVALLPDILNAKRTGDSLTVSAERGDEILVWAGEPSYENLPKRFPVSGGTISLYEYFGGYEGKFVVQVMRKGEILDERVTHVPLAEPRRVSKTERTPPADAVPAGMTEIPAGVFYYTVLSPNEPNPVVPHPGSGDTLRLEMRKFFIDIHPVTNKQYHDFVKASGYAPDDTVNYLRHWVDGAPPAELANHPVVYVSYNDAKAYCAFYGKRLPASAEWQYAAQGRDGRKYPWGNEFDSTKCNASLNETTPVDAFPSGASPFGVRDLIGNVWQMTNDVYYAGGYYYSILRGGSFYAPKGSIWYVQGGPRAANEQQMLLRVSPGFDRSSTVGFRCVKDSR